MRFSGCTYFSVGVPSFPVSSKKNMQKTTVSLPPCQKKKTTQKYVFQKHQHGCSGIGWFVDKDKKITN